MLIAQGTSPTIVFLLVREDDAVSGAPDLTPRVEISKNGAPFAQVAGAAASIGGGWYAVTLTSAETDTEGPLVLRANAESTYEWRDIHQVTAGIPVKLSESDVAQIVAALSEAGFALSADAYDRIADHVLRRDFAAAAAADSGDAKQFRSLLGAVAKQVNRVALDGRTLIVYEADDQTPLGTQSVAVNENPPAITALDTDE